MPIGGTGTAARFVATAAPLFLKREHRGLQRQKADNMSDGLIRVEREIGGRKLVLETGKIAKL